MIIFFTFNTTNINVPSTNLNNGVNLKSQAIKIPYIQITDLKVDGNFSGNLNTNLPSYFNPKQEI